MNKRHILWTGGSALKSSKVILYGFILFLLLLAYTVEGIHLENEYSILIFASALGLLINIFKSYHIRFLKPMMTVGSFIVVIFAMSVLGDNNPYGFILYLFPLTVATYGYGIKSRLSLYFVSQQLN